MVTRNIFSTGKNVIHWDISLVGAFSTETIINKLRHFGVPFSQAQFLTDAKRFHSAGELSHFWWQTYPISATGLNRDFIHSACEVLWQRFVPDRLTPEQLDELIRKGYRWNESRRYRKACSPWFEAWTLLLDSFSGAHKDLAAAGRQYGGLYDLQQWARAFEACLAHAARRDFSYHEKRLAFCGSVWQHFPESDPEAVLAFRIGIAESLFCLGKLTEGERVFQDILKDFPDRSSAYVVWADNYWRYPRNEAIPLDFEKARQLYRQALQKLGDAEGILAARLRDLEKKEQKTGSLPH